jgi:hypothetical protein
MKMHRKDAGLGYGSVGVTGCRRPTDASVVLGSGQGTAGIDRRALGTSWRYADGRFGGIQA